jgi:hypothetical protein
MWLVFRKSILTKDSLVKRGWKGDETCKFCCAKETLDHMLFGCAVARFFFGELLLVLLIFLVYLCQYV